MKSRHLCARAAAALLQILMAACSDGGDSQADVGTAPSALACESRADCEALGADRAGLVCGAAGRCEPCASDGQCRLKERCDSQTARCTFKEGYGDDCTFNDECAAGAFCVQGLCRPALEVTLCVEGRCLASGQRCNVLNGVCEVDLGCLEDGDCAEGELCNLPTRSCATRCTAESAPFLCLPTETCLTDRCSACATDDDCAAGMACDISTLSCILDDGGVVRCSSERDCALDQICDPDLGICVDKKPACTSDESCASSERCDIASGKCLARQCTPDRFEPNDTIDAALAAGRVLAEGDFAQLTICGEDVDVHLIDLVRGDSLTASLDTDVLLDGRISIEILDPKARLLGTGSLAASGVAVIDGRHAIRVAPVDAHSGTRIDYGLALSLSTGTPCDFDIFEPNDSVDTAARIDAAGIFDGLTICGEDADFFRVIAPEGLSARVQAQVTAGSAALDVEQIAPGASPHFWTPAEPNEQLYRISAPLQRAQLTYTLAAHFITADE